MTRIETTMFDEDSRGEDDDDVISEGTRRLRTAGLTDQHVAEWLTRVRLWGGQISLTPDGLRAEYARAGLNQARATLLKKAGQP